MKTDHNIKLGETITFNNLLEINDFGETYNTTPDEFECTSITPFTFKKVK